MECCHFHILDFFSSYLEVSCFNFNFQVLWAWRWFLYFLLQSYSSRILKPTGCDVKLGGAIFISSIFFLHIFHWFSCHLKKCPNRLHCEMGWCHFHFLDFFLHISSDIPIIWKLPQYAALWSKVVPFLFLGVLLFWCVPFSFLWFLFLIFPVIFL